MLVLLRIFTPRNVRPLKTGPSDPAALTGPLSHLQDLNVGLMRVRHLHPVDLHELEGRDLLGVGRVLQAAHHLVDRGGLTCPRHT